MSSQSENQSAVERMKVLHSREGSKFIFFDNNYEPQANYEKWASGYSEQGLFHFYILNLGTQLFVTADGKDVSTGKGKRLLLTDSPRDVWRWERKDKNFKLSANELAWTFKYDPETTDVVVFLEEDKDLPEQVIPCYAMRP